MANVTSAAERTRGLGHEASWSTQRAVASIVLAASALVVCAGACGCGGALPRPATVAQPTDALASVQVPPPPARVEFIPKRPARDAVWIDGEWIWRGRRWAWKVGRWVTPPAGARFSPWTTVLGPEGTVFYAPGVWRDANGAVLPEPPALALARVNSGEVDDPEGATEDTGRIVRPQTR